MHLKTASRNVAGGVLAAAPMRIHHAAAQGYQVAADAYEHGRPEYPDEAVQELIQKLGIRVGATVLELAAGTGKFTKRLVPTGARLFALEPVQAMRKRLTQNAPSALILDGTAEAIPLEARSVDAVVVAQAFHWFDGPRALAEINRVLKPGGRLGLVWNARDETANWVAQLTRIIDPHEGEAPRYRSSHWRLPFQNSAQFSPLEERHCYFVHRASPEAVVHRIESISFIAALPEADKKSVLMKVRNLLATHEQTRGLTEIAFPYRADTFVCAARE